MKDLLAEDFFLLHIPIMISAALLFSSCLLVIARPVFTNILLFGSVLSLSAIGLEYFGPHLSSNYAGYIPHFWILGALIVFIIQYRLFGKYWE